MTEQTQTIQEPIEVKEALRPLAIFLLKWYEKTIEKENWKQQEVTLYEPK